MTKSFEDMRTAYHATGGGTYHKTVQTYKAYKHGQNYTNYTAII
jgi:hypothetical protein